MVRNAGSEPQQVNRLKAAFSAQAEKAQEIKNFFEDKVNISDNTKNNARIAGGIVKGAARGTVYGLTGGMANPVAKASDCVHKDTDDPLKTVGKSMALSVGGAAGWGLTTSLATTALTPVLGPLAPVAGIGIGLTLGTGAGVSATATAIRAAEGAADGIKNRGEVVQKTETAINKAVNKFPGINANVEITDNAQKVMKGVSAPVGAVAGAAKNTLKAADEISETSVDSPAMLAAALGGKLMGLSNPASAVAALALPGMTASVRGMAEGFSEGYTSSTENKPAGEFTDSVKEKFANTKENTKKIIQENTTDKIKEKLGK
jgi:hypothetical protein